jgi:hypothetical protein
VLLLQCAGNTTLIDIFEFNFLIDTLNGAIQNELTQINTEAEQLNQTDQYRQGLSELLAMENETVNLDFLQNSSLPTVHNDLNNITTQLNDTINSPAYFSSLQAVNNITNNLLLTNGTTIHMYYDSSNITTLNCTIDPYDKLSQSEQQNLCTKAGTAIGLTVVRNRAIAQAQDVYGNITDINQRLYGFEATLPTIGYYQNQTYVWANEIRDYLNDAYNIASGLIVQVQQMAAGIAALIRNGTAAMRSNTECAYVGNAYVSLSKNLCSDVRHSLEVISAMMIVGACVFFISTVTSMLTVYKLDRDFEK